VDTVTVSDPVPPGDGPDFSVTINASAGGPAEYDLTVGFSPDATDGYDQGIDAYAPPAPPPPAFDAALSWGGERYYTQIVNGSSDDLVEHLWDIQLSYPSDNLITLTWDNTGWAGLGSFHLTDAFDGELGIDIDMTTVNSLTLDNPAFNLLKLKVTPGAPPPPGGDPDFAFDVNVTGEGNTYTMTAGFSPNATDGYDDGIDSYAPPAPP
ncbi:MAG: hypothetical protein QGF49_07885, partial [Candidatus Marinimicrobia bacterium]|nr:hypothetical protein [Candidatus Neomarinimicrobiota bacterium]